ncbi:hypothetical protein QBC34DRAFT_495578 [Podospora aff. communis PSN243]|uniref:Sequence orphan n=1 Tax=Podospora aff. communis PSN243 TaxID=3040156 RepID=A0AAV9GHQ4_9PEZI|nr:hypothetical protein QBC34DRAFT_495578 [Podospora aff. communis PSN243]
MKDGGANGLEAPRAPPKLNLEAAKAPALAAMENTQKWNTKNLSWRLGADMVSAASAAVLVAPIISIIDRSIMENASGRRTISASLRASFTSLLLRPHHTILSKPFALIFALYGGTYLTANTLDTLSSTVHNRPATTVTSGTSKFAASSAANISLCIYKDQVFARLFGPPGSGPPRPVALPTYLLFAARDCMTIFASFNVPHSLGPVLTAHLSEKVQRYASGATLAQFAAPAAVQLVSTPVHLLGLDIYNRPFDRRAGGPGWRERWKQVGRNWAVSTAARICRIVPAFGVGGVVNLKVRGRLMGGLS